MLELKNINKTIFPNSVNERIALADIDLELADGDFVTVIGSNGAGKSTVLNTIAGKLPPTPETVRSAGKKETRKKDNKRAKYVGGGFQDPKSGTPPDLQIERKRDLRHRPGI